MQQNCPDTWKLNGLGSRAECVELLESLDYTDGELGHIDGNTQGCRLLHATFAAENKDHCPHLSFVPQKDKHGRIKCQISKGKRPSELFDLLDLNFYTLF